MSMTVKKSNYKILMYLAKNTEMKASLEFNLACDTSIVYLPEMDSFVEFYESSKFYRIQKMNLSMNMLDKKNKSLWRIEKLSALDQKMIQEYIKHDGNIYEFRKSDFDERT